MESIKKYSLKDLYNQILGKNVRFISDCEFFPNFDVSCKVVKIYIKHNEILFDVRVIGSGKIITIGSNMKNLRFELI